MTYESLQDIERFAGRLEAEKIAARSTAMAKLRMQERLDAARKRAADGVPDDLPDDVWDEDRRLWNEGRID